MDEQQNQTEQFEAHRDRLRAMAYRMLGSLSEAEDAVQECWLHMSRAGTGDVENLGGWLTTVCARVCLDMLRSRKARREEPLAAPAAARLTGGMDPENEALLADSVGLALLVVLDTLAPAERLAFVLHDLFAVPFEEIASIVGRSPEAARQLASRARRRVQGAPTASSAEVTRQRAVVGAFLNALRGGDFEALVAVLDPDVVVRVEGQPEIRGARTWAQGASTFARFSGSVRMALVDGTVGLIFAPRGRLVRVLKFTVAGDKIAGAEVIADPARLQQLDLAVLEG